VPWQAPRFALGTATVVLPLETRAKRRPSQYRFAPRFRAANLTGVSSGRPRLPAPTLLRLANPSQDVVAWADARPAVTFGLGRPPPLRRKKARGAGSPGMMKPRSPRPSAEGELLELKPKPGPMIERGLYSPAQVGL